MTMTNGELILELHTLRCKQIVNDEESISEEVRKEADELLLKYIDDDQVTLAFRSLMKQRC